MRLIAPALITLREVANNYKGIALASIDQALSTNQTVALIEQKQVMFSLQANRSRARIQIWTISFE